jgi:hypothetical protein
VVEKIINNGNVYAIIIRSCYKAEGIEFFTTDDTPQQLGAMTRKKGYHIAPHKHILTERTINQTFETLVVKAGKVKISLYNDRDEYFEDIIITKGDVVLLTGCGHSLDMLEDSELVEVKQGPYINDKRPLPVLEHVNILQK